MTTSFAPGSIMKKVPKTTTTEDEADDDETAIEMQSLVVTAESVGGASTTTPDDDETTTTTSTAVVHSSFITKNHSRRLVAIAVGIIAIGFLLLLPHRNAPTTPPQIIRNRTNDVSSQDNDNNAVTATPSPTVRITSAPTTREPAPHTLAPTPQPLPPRLYFLHIPKTGSSFFRSLIQYHCNISTEEELTKYYQLITTGHWQQHDCTRTIIPGHIPLLRKDQRSVTVTLLRTPYKRLASGFLHYFHDCEAMQTRFHVDGHANVSLSMQDVCAAVQAHMEDHGGGGGNNNITQPSSSSTNSNNKNRNNMNITQLLWEYRQCVRGCGTNMLSGRPCSSPKAYNNKNNNITNIAATTLATLQSLAFFGITDQWEATLCEFQRQFPRRNGQPYLTQHINTRRNPLKGCETNVATLLLQQQEKQQDYDNDPDQPLYTAASQLFVERLSPQCRAKLIR